MEWLKDTGQAFKGALCKSQNIFSASFVLIGIVLLLPVFPCNCTKCLSIIAIGLVDIYLIIALGIAALMSEDDRKISINCVIPTKTGGLIVVAVFVVVIILGFANIYFKMSTTQQTGTNPDFCPSLSSKNDALYFSTVTAATVGYGDFKPKSPSAKRYVIFEIFSSILLFFAAFPLLISRISDFKKPPSKDAAGTTEFPIEITVDGIRIDIDKSKAGDPKKLSIKVNGGKWAKEHKDDNNGG